MVASSSSRASACTSATTWKATRGCSAAASSRPSRARRWTWRRSLPSSRRSTTTRRGRREGEPERRQRPRRRARRRDVYGVGGGRGGAAGAAAAAVAAAGLCRRARRRRRRLPPRRPQRQLVPGAHPRAARAALGADAPAAETLTVAPPYELWCNSLAPDGRVRLAVAGAAQRRGRLTVSSAPRAATAAAPSRASSPRTLRAQFGAIISELAAPVPQARWRLGDRPDRAPRRRRWHPRRYLRVCAAHRPPLWRQADAAAPELPELPAADAEGGGSGGDAVIYEAASWEQIRSALGFGGRRQSSKFTAYKPRAAAATGSNPDARRS